MNRVFKKSVLIFFFAFSIIQSHAQEVESAAIKKTIDNLFNGMRTGDSALLASAFAPGATLQTLVNKKDGTVTVRTESLDDFIKSVSKPHPEIYDEQISYGTINIDGNLSAAWTPYKFYIGTTFSHCGVNSFQLVKLNGSWKIQYIIDTRRKTCN